MKSISKSAMSAIDSWFIIFAQRTGPCMPTTKDVLASVGSPCLLLSML